MIPEIIKTKASNNGYNHVEYVGEMGGSKIYAVSYKHANGTPGILGLPVLYLLDKRHNISEVNGEKSFELLRCFP